MTSRRTSLVFAAIPFDVQTKILSFCGTKELLTLRRTSVSAFSVVLDREFRARTPGEVLASGRIEDVRVYVVLLNHASENVRPLICKTAGYKLFRLRDADTKGLQPRCVRNHHYASAADVQLFSRVDLFICGIKRHGSVAQMRAYDAKVKQRTLVQRENKRVLSTQLSCQREPFLDRDEQAYRRYLGYDDRSKEAHKTYKAQSLEIQTEYYEACGRNPREYEHFKQEVHHRTRALLSEYYRIKKMTTERDTANQAPRASPETNKKRKTTSDVCVTCLNGPAARACVFQKCGVCCGRSSKKGACLRHAARCRN